MSARPFQPSRLSRRFAALAAATSRLSRARAIAIVIAALGLVGFVEHVIGPEINTVVFYLVITCFATWSLGLPAGLTVAAITIVMASTLKGSSYGVPFPHQAGGNLAMWWNTVARLTATSATAVLVAGLRGALDLERYRAETDMLTGALNKSAFLARMDETIARARQAGAVIMLAYLDLDGFKAINDRYGHAAGDGVLCAFADAGGKAVRRTDLFARFGGDEFVVLLSVPDCAQGDVAAERLHARLAEILRRTGYPVTCSMGALILPAQAVADREQMIDVADRLMYEVKQAGKNAIRIARADLGDGPRALFPTAVAPLPHAHAARSAA